MEGLPLRWLNEALGDKEQAAAIALSDEACMQRYRQGDDQAFRLLYQRYREKLHRYVLRLSARESEAEEVFQEVWIAVIRSRDSYDSSASFATWLFSIAHRRAADRWRALSRHAPDGLNATDDLDDALPLSANDAIATPEREWQSQSLGEALLDAIGKLPLPQREAFLMKAEGELSLDDIALATGANRETVKSRLRYAQKRLREVMLPWR
jgi:RNA polymerase sigma-70 factor (ECF subfamily)